MLFHVERPPLERGTTWSNVRSFVLCVCPQYWHIQWSRRNTLNLVKAGLRAIGMYSFNASTLGSFISRPGDRTIRSYSEITVTLSLNIALTASCQGHTDNG